VQTKPGKKEVGIADLRAAIVGMEQQMAVATTHILDSTVALAILFGMDDPGPINPKSYGDMYPIYLQACEWLAQTDLGWENDGKTK